MFNCFDCNRHFDLSDELLYHVTLFHSDRVKAGSLHWAQPQCNRSFERFSSYSRHVKKHKVDSARVERTVIVPEAPESEAPRDPSEPLLNSNLSGNFLSSENGGNVEINDKNVDVSLTNAVLAFLGKLYSIDTLSRNHVQLMGYLTIFFWDSHLKELKK